jgi:NAD(P)-dependent dehydrogenase (short-subunit alcohol dehydrogenase family)
VSAFSALAGRGPSGFGYGSTAEDVTRDLSLAGKTLLVTGCSSGIGFETLRVLALRGARVIATGRSLDRARQACASVAGETLPLACELSDPESVRACVAEVRRLGLELHAIIANAGIMALPKLELLHGYELQFLTNHIGHFMLVTGLLESLSPAARVVMVSSDAHRRAPPAGIDFDNLSGERSYRGWTAYGRSKLANLLFAKQLARRFDGSARTANAVHPGVIRTQLQRHMPSVVSAAMTLAGPLVLKTVEQGAATQVYVATRPELANVSGQFFANCNLARPRPDADDAELARKLWETSERIVAGLA